MNRGLRGEDGAVGEDLDCSGARGGGGGHEKVDLGGRGEKDLRGAALNFDARRGGNGAVERDDGFWSRGRGDA